MCAVTISRRARKSGAHGCQPAGRLRLQPIWAPTGGSTSSWWQAAMAPPARRPAIRSSPTPCRDRAVQESGDRIAEQVDRKHTKVVTRVQEANGADRVTDTGDVGTGQASPYGTEAPAEALAGAG